jgi:hypothetical protein
VKLFNVNCAIFYMLSDMSPGFFYAGHPQNLASTPPIQKNR